MKKLYLSLFLMLFPALSAEAMLKEEVDPQTAFSAGAVTVTHRHKPKVESRLKRSLNASSIKAKKHRPVAVVTGLSVPVVSGPKTQKVSFFIGGRPLGRRHVRCPFADLYQLVKEYDKLVGEAAGFSLEGFENSIGEEAIKLYSKVKNDESSKKKASLFYLIGYCAEHGRGIIKDPKAAMSFYTLARNMGHKGAAAKVRLLEK